jgi:hypothetical protein
MFWEPPKKCWSYRVCLNSDSKVHFLEIFWKKVELIGTDPDRHALDADPDPAK